MVRRRGLLYKKNIMVKDTISVTQEMETDVILSKGDFGFWFGGLFV